MPLPDGRPARIMVVTAHPVDAFDNSGGTCAEHIQQGDQVTAVLCTSGIHTHNERLLDELRKPETERDISVMRETAEVYAARKRKEAEESLGCFGITDVVVLPYDDGKFDIQPEMVGDLEELICDRRPHIIIQQNPAEGLATFDDHSIVGVATSHAIARAQRPRYGSTRTPWEAVEVYYLGVFGVDYDGLGQRKLRPDVYVDVTKHYRAKVRAHQAIATQGQNIGWGQKRLEAIEGHVGVFAGASYAEAFIRARIPVFNTLPINERRYEDIKLPSAERARKNHQLLGAFVRERDGGFVWGIDPDAE